jgi:hypothetical protein
MAFTRQQQHDGDPSGNERDHRHLVAAKLAFQDLA